MLDRAIAAIRARARAGSIAALLNNAASDKHHPIDETIPESWAFESWCKVVGAEDSWAEAERLSFSIPQPRLIGLQFSRARLTQGVHALGLQQRQQFEKHFGGDQGIAQRRVAARHRHAEPLGDGF